MENAPSTTPPPPSSQPVDSLNTPISSEMSLGFPEACPSNVANLVPNCQPAIPPSEKSTPSRDACCVAIYCELHEKFQLTQLKNKGLFLPTAWMLSTDSQTLTADKLARSSLRAQHPKATITTPLRQVDWYRVQHPKRAPTFRNRATFVASIIPDAKTGKVCCCETATGAAAGSPPVYEWLTLEEIKQRQHENLWGPEAFTLLEEARDNFAKMHVDPKLEENGWGVWLHEVDTEDSTMMLANRDNEFTKERELLFSARYNEAEIQKLFNEFAVQCFPSQFMCLASFRLFMSKLGWPEDESLHRSIFAAFVATGGRKEAPLAYLTFNELLLGLAAMEERTEHRGNCFQLRLKFIFNFYDSNADQKLHQSEVTRLVNDINVKKPPPHYSRYEMSRSSDGIRQEISAIRAANSNGDLSASLTAELYQRLADISPATEESTITMEQFTNCPDTKTMDWLAELTDPLFRSGQSTIETASQKFAYKRSTEKGSPMAIQVALLNRHDETCERCRQTRFDLCTHGIRVDEYGRIRGTIKFDLSPDCRDVDFHLEMTIDEATFNWIIQFTRYVSTMRSPNVSPRPNREGIKSVLKLVLTAVKEEPAIARPFSPCYIVGEVRSNLEILYRLQVTVAGWIPFANPVNLVFLGNLVDPSEPLAADTAVLFFCLKAFAPNRLTLIRGPMEHLTKLSNSKMHSEWVELYGEDTWKDVELIFEQLPVAAVVDDRLFLTKSGLPQPIKEIGQIEALNQSPKEPIVSAPLIQSLLHGVPLKRSTRRRLSKQSLQQQQSSQQSKGKPSSRVKAKRQKTPASSEMRGKRTKRKPIKTKGTTRKQSAGKPSSLNTKAANGSSGNILSSARADFTPSQLHQFLRLNHFSHVIRTEMLPVGALGSFRVADHGRLITLGGIGRQVNSKGKWPLFGSIALVNRQKIRVIRLESRFAG